MADVWNNLHFRKGQTVREFAEQMNQLVASGMGEVEIPWASLGGLAEEADFRLPIKKLNGSH